MVKMKLLFAPVFVVEAIQRAIGFKHLGGVVYSCFEFVAQSFALIDMKKAREACNEIMDIKDQAGNVVHTRERCYNLIGAA